jgi:radical SAM protein with 4Fe4S-binding SPASM domain
MSLGNVTSRSLSSLAGNGNEAWAHYKGIAEVPAECAGCDFQGTCRGGCPSPGYLQRGSLAIRDPRCAVAEALIPICPFIKRTAGTRHRTNISPYYFNPAGPGATTASPASGASR